MYDACMMKVCHAGSKPSVLIFLCLSTNVLEDNKT